MDSDKSPELQLRPLPSTTTNPNIGVQRMGRPPLPPAPSVLSSQGSDQSDGTRRGEHSSGAAVSYSSLDMDMDLDMAPGLELTPQSLQKTRSEDNIPSGTRDRRHSVHLSPDGRVHFQSEEVALNEKDDPLLPLFQFIASVQLLDLPLILGVIAAMIMANTIPSTYKFYFTSGRCDDSSAEYHDGSAGYGNSTTHRQLAAGGCIEDRYLLSECPVSGHQFTLHFVANDIVMVGHFALVMKEVTEALLPGGSLNPPSKALNPLLTCVGAVGGPIVAYFGLLKLAMELGMFEDEIARGHSWSSLSNGWGIVTATDVVLAWLVARVVFGHGHPAIDYVLLLGVMADFFTSFIIAFYYPDDVRGFDVTWLLVAAVGVLNAYLLRKWHFRKRQVEHQDWQSYVVLGGIPVWIGLIKAHIHPALALNFIVPFMPGPNAQGLADIDEDVEEEFENEASLGHAKRYRDSIVGTRSLDLESAHQKELGDGLLPAPLVAPEHVGRGSSSATGGTFSPVSSETDSEAQRQASAEPLSRSSTWSSGLFRRSISSQSPHFATRQSSIESEEEEDEVIVLREHHDHASGRALTIQSGLYAGLLGHAVEDSLKVVEYDEEGHEVFHTSTLDEFEQFWKVYIDFGMGFFALTNAGVHVRTIGAMTWVVSLALLIGNYVGIVVMYKVAKRLGFPAPLGIRTRHVRMIAIISAIGLTVSLFIADHAFTDVNLQGDAKLGALFSGLFGVLCWLLSLHFDFSHEDVAQQAHEQMEEEIKEIRSRRSFVQPASSAPRKPAPPSPRPSPLAGKKAGSPPRSMQARTQMKESRTAMVSHVATSSL